MTGRRSQKQATLLQVKELFASGPEITPVLKNEEVGPNVPQLMRGIP